MAEPRATSGQVVNILTARPTHTTALLKAERLEVIRLALPAGTRMPRHAAPGEITLLGLSGRMRVLLDDRSLVICAGDFVHLQGGVAHAVEAYDDVQVLLTLCLLPTEREEAEPRKVTATLTTKTEAIDG